ncbi:MAG: hypothetical protein N2111_01480 [Candidatus Sumerlaeaceae bacterium]|nr:hypothetical protein [Candidatus Sumerlaeaceae bacterium]
MICRPSVAVDAVDVMVKRDLTPKIDGRISDEEKAQTPPISMTILGSLDKPKYSTAVYMSFLKDGFYAGFVVADPEPQNLVTRVKTENGPVFTDDSIQLLICPEKDTDRTNYFHFAVNAAGVRYSMDMDRDRPVTGWESAVQTTNEGWEAEIFLPYKVIRSKTQQGFWRGNVARVRAARDGAPEETSVWVNPGATLHNFRRFGFLRIVDPQAPQPKRDAETTTETTATTATAP